MQPENVSPVSGFLMTGILLGLLFGGLTLPWNLAWGFTTTLEYLAVLAVFRWLQSPVWTVFKNWSKQWWIKQLQSEVEVTWSAGSTTRLSNQLGREFINSTTFPQLPWCAVFIAFLAHWGYVGRYWKKHTFLAWVEKTCLHRPTWITLVYLPSKVITTCNLWGVGNSVVKN